MAKTVLVIEDDHPLQELFELRFEGAGITVLKAYTLADAVEQYENNPDVDAVLFCGKLVGETTYDGNDPGTVRWFKEQGYAGRMFGCSADSSLLHLLEQAGCEMVIDKMNAVPRLIEAFA